MGLDGVELLMALEEAFGIEIKDEETVKTVTPGSVIDLIYSKVRHADQKVCPSQRAFYILRKVCVRQFCANRKTFSLDTPIRSLIAQEREAADWKILQSIVAARSWPELGRPRWLVVLLMVLSLMITSVSLWFWIWTVSSSVSVLIGFVCALIPVMGLYRLTQRYRNRIPIGIHRVRDIVPYAVTAETVEWTREQVAQLVKIVVQEQLRIPDSQYREDAHFINDFGMD